MKVRILPGQGGAIGSLIVKSDGKELVGKPTVTESLVLPAGARLSLGELPFESEEIRPGASCKLSAMLPPNPQIGVRAGMHEAHQYYPEYDFTRVRLEKTYELAGGVAGLSVSYTFTNTGDEPVKICPAFTRNFRSEAKSRGLVVSSRDGPLPVEHKHPLYASYFDRNQGTAYTGAQAWIGFEPAGTGQRLLNRFDPRHTSAIRVLSDVPECVGTRVELDPGKSFTTRTWILLTDIPLRSLGGVGDGLVGAVELSPPTKLTKAEVLEGRLENPEKIFGGGDEEPEIDDLDLEDTEGVVPKEMATKKGYLKGKKVELKLALTSAENSSLQVTGHARPLPEGESVALGTKGVSLRAGTRNSVSFDFVPSSVGTWLTSFEILKDGKLLGAVERPVEVQGPSGFVLPRAPQDRAGELFRDWGKFDPFDIHPQPTLEVQVPHTRYAKPYARGKVRAAVVIPWQIGREVVELAQRIDLDLQCVFIGSHGFIWEQKLMPGRRRRAPNDEVHAMKDALNAAPQVIALIGTPLKWFPQDVEDEIVRQVRAGAGLVLCPAWEAPESIRTLIEGAKERLPYPGEGCATATLGKGRVCFFEASGMEISYRPQMATSELRLEQFSRALLWAARMEPRVTLQTKPKKLALENTSPEALKVDVELSNRSEGDFAGTLELVARQDRATDFASVYGKSYCLGVMLSMPYALLEDVASVGKKVALQKGDSKTVSIDVPVVRAGTYRLYTILKDADGRTADWNYTPAAVSTTYSLETFAIEKRPIGPERLFGFRPEDTARVTLRFRAKGAVGQDLSAFLMAEDKTGRRIISQKCPLKFENGEAAAVFESQLHGAHRRLLILRVGLESQGQILLEARKPLHVREGAGRQPKFRFVLMDNEANLPLHLTGISEQMGPYDTTLFSWYDLNVWPTGTFLQEGNREEEDRKARDAEAKRIAKEAKEAAKGITEPEDEDEDDEFEGLIEEKQDEEPKAPRGFIRKLCFNNPSVRRRKVEELRRFALRKNQLGPQYVYFTHEYSYGSNDVCQCGHCQAAFREKLKQTHGTLDGLNRAWGTRYKSWDEVFLYRVEKGLKPPPMKDWPWVIATWQYKSTQLADLCHEIVKAGKEITDDIDYGHIALSKMGLWIGMDFWEWSRVGDKHIMYRDVEEWQSMCGSPTSTGWHSGYGRQYNPSEAQCKLWSRLVDGAWGIAHFTCPGYPLARADGVFFDGAQALFGNLKEIQRGWDELLLGHDHKDGIGLYRSTPSFAVHMMEFWQATGGKGSKGDMDWERRFAHFLTGAARSYKQARAHYIYHGQVLEGRLGLFGKPKIIFLCYTTAMSPREAEVLREFVRDGGTLVGGVNVATRDWHGKPLKQPLLDEVFGIDRIGEYQPAFGVMPDEGPTRIEFVEPVAEVTECNQLVVGPPNVRVADGAKARASYELNGTQCPAFIVNEYGKGRAVYLNFLPLHFNQNNGKTWDEETAGASSALVRHLVEQSGIEPFERVEYGETTSLRCPVGRFVDGENRYLAAIAHWGFGPRTYRNCTARLHLLEPRHVYDARREKYLGHGVEFPMEFTPEKLATVYSLLPYKVEGLEIAPVKEPAKPGGVAEFRVKVRTDGKAPGRHVIRVTVFGPDGNLQEVHCYNLIAKDGEAIARVHLGFNEPTGKWEIQLRDVGTGVRAVRSLDVTGHGR